MKDDPQIICEPDGSYNCLLSDSKGNFYYIEAATLGKLKMTPLEVERLQLGLSEVSKLARTDKYGIVAGDPGYQVRALFQDKA